MDRDKLFEYARVKYEAEPEFLWKKYPNYFVLRHPKSRKWFAVGMDVPGDRLGLPGDETVYILDVKCGPILAGSYLDKRGFLPSYHMNKKNWITILLDGTVPREDIAALLEISYRLAK